MSFQVPKGMLQTLNILFAYVHFDYVSSPQGNATNQTSRHEKKEKSYLILFQVPKGMLQTDF